MFAVSRTNVLNALKGKGSTYVLSVQNAVCNEFELLLAQHRACTVSQLTGRLNLKDVRAMPCAECDDGASTKPPNIVVHHGNGAEQNVLRQLVTSLVGSTRYTVYDLPLEAPPVWIDNASLVVVSGELNAEVSGNVESFFRGGGSVLSLSSSLTLGLVTAEPTPCPAIPVQITYGDLPAVQCDYSATVRRLAAAGDDTRLTRPAVVRAADGPEPVPALLRWSGGGGGGTALLSQVRWDPASPSHAELLRALLRQELGVRCDAAPEEVRYAPGYLLADAASVARFAAPAANAPSSRAPALRLVSAPDELAASAELLPLLGGPPPAALFDAALYRRHLQTRELGRCLLFAPTVTSGLDVLRDSRLGHGGTVVCDRQTRGRGRAGNVWLSPTGCCMVSVRLLVELGSPLGGRLGLLQHAAVLAVVEAVGDARLGLKWPNDLYWRGRHKVGGVLAEADVCGGLAVCRLGVGVNLDNAAPTVCLNSVLAAPLARELLVARALSCLERLLELEADELGRRFRQHWLHERQPVTVWRDGRPLAARVSGLDEHGFLLVRTEPDGAELAVSPDGNSFDMMRGLIVPKQPAGQ